MDAGWTRLVKLSNNYLNYYREGSVSRNATRNLTWDRMTHLYSVGKLLNHQ